MIKLGIGVMTNRPDKFKRFMQSTKHLSSFKIKIGVHVTPPAKITDFDLCGIDVIDYGEHFTDGIFNCCDARKASLRLVYDCDVILWADDDFQFKPHEDKYVNYALSSDDAIRQGTKMLLENESIGFINMASFLGGANYQRRFSVTKTINYETAKGILTRPDVINTFDFSYPGVGEDIGFCTNALFNGYAGLKLFNVMTVKDKSKKIGHTDDPVYLPETAERYLQKFMVERFGIRYKLGGKLPAKCLTGINKIKSLDLNF